MRTTNTLKSMYDRVSRKLFTEAFELEIADRNNSCIFCGTPESQQSVYYPPKHAAERTLINGRRGVVAYCCSKHYMRYRTMSANSPVGLTFEDFYHKISVFGERSGPVSIAISEKPLPTFRMANDGEIWYLGFGAMNFVRVELPVYESFKELVTSSDIQYIPVKMRRAMFTDWRASNEVNDRELMALEHFLKL